MPDLYIIKLGGSVITEKEGNRLEAKQKTIARIASEIGRAMKEKGFKLIVVHGAGPFGHTNVSQYSINDGVYSERQKEGLQKTIRDCNFLDSVVVEGLKKAGINAVGLDPNRIVIQENKRIVSFETKNIEKALRENKVPVLYGQMVPDKKLNASVISGDAIIVFLAEKLKVSRILIGTDVSGIFTDDPKRNPKAERIPIINKKNFDSVMGCVGESQAIDVTQGMKGKILKIKDLAKGKEVLLFNANEKDSVFKALTGKKIDCTEIML